jgi:hypothetical protein
MAERLSARTGSIQAVEENVAAIKSWDRALLLKRSAIERLSDRITAVAAGAPSICKSTCSSSVK